MNAHCANCGLPISQILDPWGGVHGWHHPTIERELNVDGEDVRAYATFCPDDSGEAEPVPAFRFTQALAVCPDCGHYPCECPEWQGKEQAK